MSDVRALAAEIVARRAERARDLARQIVANRKPAPALASNCGEVMPPAISLTIQSLTIQAGDLTVAAGTLSQVVHLAPNITVEPPTVHVAAPAVTVEVAAPSVTVEAPPAPSVTVEAPQVTNVVHVAPAEVKDVRVQLDVPPRPPRVVRIEGPAGDYTGTLTDEPTAGEG